MRCNRFAFVCHPALDSRTCIQTSRAVNDGANSQLQKMTGFQRCVRWLKSRDQSVNEISQGSSAKVRSILQKQQKILLYSTCKCQFTTLSRCSWHRFWWLQRTWIIAFGFPEIMHPHQSCAWCNPLTTRLLKNTRHSACCRLCGNYVNPLKTMDKCFSKCLILRTILTG